MQPRPTSPSRSLLHRLATLHDRLTIAGFTVATALVGVIAASFCYEVVVRYFFDAPTSWSYSLVTYLLCAMIFLTVPELTRRGAHININFLAETLSPRRARRLRYFIGGLATMACLVAGWITAEESVRQYVQDVSTISEFPIPKWWVSILIPYGLLSSAIHFLRHLGGEVGHTLNIDGAGQ